ncbi:transposase (fragment) [Thiomonas sp. X19]
MYLAVVLDLFSRQVVGWSMQPRMDRELASSALLMAVWRRRPSGEVLVHSDKAAGSPATTGRTSRRNTTSNPA